MSRPQATSITEAGATFDDLTTPKPDRLPTESIRERCLKSAGDCNTGSLQSFDRPVGRRFGLKTTIH